MLLKIFLIAALTIFPSFYGDYCDKSLCNGAKHVACNHKERFYPQCPRDIVLVPITSDLKRVMLYEHNVARDLLASGRHPRGFDPAVRMCKMQWSSQLSYLASLNAMKCTKSHDECREDPQYAYVGQNLYSAYKSGAPVDPKTIASNGIKKWIAEDKKTSQKHLNKLGSKKGIGHYTQVVSDRACYVGCAMTMWQKGKKEFSYLVCNYSYGNVVGAPAYQKSGDRCQSGYDSEFTSLCSSSEAKIVNKENLKNKK